jgi:hypothetical protein
MPWIILAGNPRICVLIALLYLKFSEKFLSTVSTKKLKRWIN